LKNDIEKIYGLGIFKSVDYEILQKDSKSYLTIRTKEKDWGPNYVRFGANVESDFVGAPKINVTAGYNVVPFGKSGSEWRTEAQLGYDNTIHTEFYQPLDKHLRYFVAPWARYTKRNFEDYDLETETDDYIIASSQIGLSVGRSFENWGSLSVSANSQSGDPQPNIDNLSIAGLDSNSGSWALNFYYDQLDSFSFPRKGIFGSVSHIENRRDLGATLNQSRVRINALWAKTFYRSTIVVWPSMAGIFDTPQSSNSGYAIGGLFSLSGFDKYELVGRYAAVMRLMYFKDIGNTESLLKIPFYIGASWETGNVWDSHGDIQVDSLLSAGSIFIGFDTLIGPLYLAHGVAQGDRQNSYLFLGRNFTYF
jgi:NTE family protein